MTDREDLVDDIAAELQRRLEMWRALGRGQPRQATPLELDEIGIRPHRTGHGIYCDLVSTRGLAPSGIVLSVLHTGSSYDDDLSEDGVIYHYPRTTRASRDRNEIEATKTARELDLPVFVVSGSGPTRLVHLGWVTDHDDEAGIFLIEFGDSPVGATRIDDHPFVLKSATRRTTRSSDRPARSRRFKFDVLRRYGARCAVCDVTVIDLIDAAHLCPVEAGGSDDPRNGLPFCANHHRAFDRGLLTIDSISMAVTTNVDLGVTVPDLDHLRAKPHPSALAHATKRRRSGS